MHAISFKDTRVKWIVIGVVIGTALIGCLTIGYWIRIQSSPQKPSETQNTLTIASFKSEVMEDDPRIKAYLDLQIINYWIEGNQVKCNGRVRWYTNEYIVEGLSVCMFITRNYTMPNSVNVEVVVYGGILFLPTGTIDSDSVSIPKLGEQIFSFDFSLTCTYHP